MPRVFWIIFAAMFASWLTMNVVTAPRIEALAGGDRLLDMRFTGYSFDEVQAFLEQIGANGIALYLGAQSWLDMIFPPLLGAVLFLTYRWLFPGRVGLTIGVISLLYVATDILENLAIHAVLRTGAAGVTPEMVASANFWTVTKWSFAVVGLVTLLVGVALRVRRRWVGAATGLG